MSKKFIKNKENFICEKCGTSVKGNGFTNHCTKCLYSKHVDNNPGDRAAECKGLMEPTGVVAKKGEFVIIHKCILCGHIKPNKSSEDDDFEKILEIIARSRS